MLGEGEDGIAVLDVKDFRTKAAKEARDAARAAGKTVVKAADFAAAEIVADELKVRLARKGIKLTGSSEQKVEWTEETEEDGSVLCRGMIDHLVMHFTDVTGATIYDVKTIRSAHPKTVQRHILEYGYDIQEAAYRSAVGHIVPEAIGRIDFVFLFCEIEPPYACTPVRLTGSGAHRPEQVGARLPDVGALPQDEHLAGLRRAGSPKSKCRPRGRLLGEQRWRAPSKTGRPCARRRRCSSG
jgi:hypothetical protein